MCTLVHALLHTKVTGERGLCGNPHSHSDHFGGGAGKNSFVGQQQHRGAIDAIAAGGEIRLDTFYQFDDVVTCPLHGFAGADDYWRRA